MDGMASFVVFRRFQHLVEDVILHQNKVSNVGTISDLPAAFGIFCASVVINDLLGK